MHSTVLQLVGVTTLPNGNASKVAVIGSSQVVIGVETSDIALDANLGRQPKLANENNAPIEAAGIGLNGSNITIRRVRVVGWGTYTKLDPDTLKSGECFPIYIEGSGSAGRNVIEDCIIEYPALSKARETTMTNCHAHHASPSVFSVVRNNYINGDEVGGFPDFPSDVTNMSYIGSTLTVVTKYPNASPWAMTW